MKCQHDKYTEKRFAMEDIGRIFKPNVIKHLPIKVYYCENCQAWHITTPMVAMANKILELTEKPLKKEHKEPYQRAYEKMCNKHFNMMNEYAEREDNYRATIENLRNEIKELKRR